MNTSLAHALAAVGYISAGITAGLVVALRWWWRRGKRLQEP